jgi:hypothetical protein
MAFKTPKAVIQAKIRKYQQYERLLDDPDFVALLPELHAALISSSGKNPVPSRNQSKLALAAPKKKSGRKPGPLFEKALRVVINAMREVSAKDVLAILESEGTTIPGKHKAVTVSKVLRQLAKAHRISARPSSPKKKAALLYRSNAIAQSFSVQEKVVTQ